MVLRVVPIPEIFASMAIRESVKVGAWSTIPPLPTAFKFSSSKYRVSLKKGTFLVFVSFRF